jgi:hypothetical protein
MDVTRRAAWANAIVNAPLLPFRQMAGGAEYAWNRPEWTPWNRATLGTAATGVSGAFGIVEGLCGSPPGARHVTGGYFSLAPERATEISIEPEVSVAISDKRTRHRQRTTAAVR